MLKNTSKIGFFEFWTKFSPLMCQFFSFKRCTMIAFSFLQKPYVWEKSGFRVIELLANQIVEFFKLEYLINYSRCPEISQFSVSLRWVELLYWYFACSWCFMKSCKIIIIFLVGVPKRLINPANAGVLDSFSATLCRVQDGHTCANKK